MPAKQGDNRNKIAAKRLCLYGILAALCIICGYIEGFIPTTLIAPGIKIGLSNAVVLMLVMSEDIKGAFAVNITRILLSSLLFGSAMSLIFSLSGGIMSLVITFLLKKTDRFGALGLSIAGAAAHNIFQCLAAACLIGVGVFYYLPVLIIGGVLCGAAVSMASMAAKKAYCKQKIF